MDGFCGAGGHIVLRLPGMEGDQEAVGRKGLDRLFFHHIHLLFEVLAALLQYMFDLGDGNYREELREQEITRKEQSEGSQVKADFPNRWCLIHSP